MDIPATALAPLTITIDELGSRAPSASADRLDPLANPFVWEMASWQQALHRGLGQRCFQIRALRENRLTGFLPLAFVSSRLFGKFLVSLPYINSSGVWCDREETATQLIDAAKKLADQLDVKYLELRQEREIAHPQLSEKNADKVLMRLPLPSTTDELWKAFKSKLRSQIRSGEKHPFEICWGREDLLRDFYRVFSHNMRDLGTPVYPVSLFRSMLESFGDRAELCVVRLERRAVAVAILIHGPLGTEVPSASSLRQYNSTNANMVMYWNLLKRAIERRQPRFDFGRSTVDGNTFRFKQQWGAVAHQSVWQYYVRRGPRRRCVLTMQSTNWPFGCGVACR